MGNMLGGWFSTAGWPNIDEEIRMLEEYRDELREELKEVERRVERLKKK